MKCNSLEDIRQESKVEFLPILSQECEEVLIDLIKKIKPTSILEIGTCVGYSSTIMLLNSNATIDTIEIDEERLEKAKALWENYKLQDRVNYYLGDVDKILDKVIENKTYDLIFIDGPKSRYLDHFIKTQKAMHENTIVLCDDVLFFGLVKGEEKVAHKHRTIVRHLREFLSFIEERDDLNVEILDKGNGIAIIRKI
ncbi:MAG: class I SAM-dependent methyltransferase [Christensenella sp.]|nr:class I SAM-dependent methyltransferase [Christensenella sp.]